MATLPGFYGTTAVTPVKAWHFPAEVTKQVNRNITVSVGQQTVSSTPPRATTGQLWPEQLP